VEQYSKKYLEERLPTAKIVPAAIQLELHPWLPQSEITSLCKEKGIQVIAYSPLGSTGSPLVTVEPIVKLAEKHNVSPVTILLSHHGKFLFSPALPFYEIS
jgi:diketogulonate reductase-like aldo/keto reductase